MQIVMVAGLPDSGRSEAAAALATALAAGGQRAALVAMGGDPTAAPLRVTPNVTHHTTSDGCVACHSGQALMRTLDRLHRSERPAVVVVELSATALPDALRPYVDTLEDVPVEGVRVVVTAAACGAALAHQQALAFLFENMLRTADAAWLPTTEDCTPEEIEAAAAALREVGGGPVIVGAADAALGTLYSAI